jgi:carbonic anhydrase
MELFTNAIMGDLLGQSLATASFENGAWKNTGSGPGSPVGKEIDWLTIKDQAQSVREDVEKIRNHPLVPKSISVYGYIFDVASGKLNQVSQAAKA